MCDPFAVFLSDKQEAKFGGLVEIMQQSKKIFKTQHQPTETGSLLGIFSFFKISFLTRTNNKIMRVF